MQILTHDDPHAAHAGVPALTLSQWRDARDTWPDGQLASLQLAPTDDVADLRPDLARINQVLLDFPKWTDGRAYSQARLLRGRLAFRGDVRATGDVTADMAPLLARTGFSSALLRSGQSADVARRALAAFDGHYQGDRQEPRPWFARAAA